MILLIVIVLNSLCLIQVCCLCLFVNSMWKVCESVVCVCV